MTDTDMTIKPVETKQPAVETHGHASLPEEPKPQIAIGLIPCLNSYFVEKAWSVILPIVKDFAEKSQGEYNIYKVYRDIFYGGAHLYMAYVTTEQVTNENRQKILMDCMDNPSKNFAGYILVRPDPESVHLWQAYIVPEYQNTNVRELGFKYIEEQMKQIGAPYMTFSSLRNEWALMCKKYGFEEVYTVYRKKMGNNA